jgi:hypothetical protein
MHLKKLATAILFAVLGSKAFGSIPNSGSGKAQDDLDSKAIQRGIITLMKLEVIEWQNGGYVIKDESALEQLRHEGRVDLIKVAEHVICWGPG